MLIWFKSFIIKLNISIDTFLAISIAISLIGSQVHC